MKIEIGLRTCPTFPFVIFDFQDDKRGVKTCRFSIIFTSYSLLLFRLIHGAAVDGRPCKVETNRGSKFLGIFANIFAGSFFRKVLVPYKGFHPPTHTPASTA